MLFAVPVLLFATIAICCYFALRESPLSPVRTPLSACVAVLALIGMMRPVSSSSFLLMADLTTFFGVMGVVILLTILIAILDWLFPGIIREREDRPVKPRYKHRQEFRPPKPPTEPPESSRQHHDVDIDELRLRMREEQFRERREP